MTDPPGRDYLLESLKVWPVCHALLRAIECRKLSRFPLAAPVLDIGCGDGIFARLLFDVPLEAGIDRNASEIGKAKTSGAYRSAQVASATDLPFAELSFANVFSNCVLEHIDDLDRALHEVFRVLRPGGQLLATVPTPRWESEGPFPALRRLGLRALSDWMSLRLRSFWHHVTVEEQEGWRTRLARTGLTMQVWEPYMVPEAYAAYARHLPWAIPAFFWRRLTGTWGIAPGLRRWLTPRRARRLRSAYLAEDSVGACAVFLARKEA